MCSLQHDDYPGERLIVCYNPALAHKSREDREDLLKSTEEDLIALQERFDLLKRRLSKDKVGLAIGPVINRYKVKKYFRLSIEDDSFTFHRDDEKIAADQRRDGIYVIQTSLPEDKKSDVDCVRTYKSLTKAEGAFRIFKSALKVRPIYHWRADRVRAHLLLCMLAYYVEWHMRQVLQEMLFMDEDLEVNKATQGPNSLVRSGERVLKKKQRKKLPNGTPVSSFRVMIDSLTYGFCFLRWRESPRSK